MLCKILNFDFSSRIYELEFPNGTRDVYHRNDGVNLLVGRKSKADIVDCFYFKQKSNLFLKLEPVTFFYNEGNYIVVNLRNPGTLINRDDCFLHLIVAFSWIKKPECEFGLHLNVEHCNRDKNDNRPENLKHVTRVFNAFKEWALDNSKGKKYLLEKLEEVTDPREILYAIGEVLNDKLINDKYEQLFKLINSYKKVEE